MQHPNGIKNRRPSIEGPRRGCYSLAGTGTPLTTITHLVQAGVDLPTVKRISGHKTLAMVERYSHQNGEHIQAAMDKLEKRLRVVNK